MNTNELARMEYVVLNVPEKYPEIHAEFTKVVQCYNRELLSQKEYAFRVTEIAIDANKLISKEITQVIEKLKTWGNDSDFVIKYVFVNEMKERGYGFRYAIEIFDNYEKYGKSILESIKA